MRRNANRVFYIMLFLVISGLIYLLAPILTPFFAGALLAYLLNPAVNGLQRLRLSRVMSVTLLFLVMFIVLFILILMLVPLIQAQVESLIDSIPNMLNWIEKTVAPWVSLKISNHRELIDIASVKSMLASTLSKAGNVADIVVSTALQSGKKIAEWLANLVLIPVVTFYLLCDWKKFIKGFDNILPRHIEPTVVKLTAECDSVLSEFFRGQLIIILLLCLYYSAGLAFAGLQIGLTIGTIAGLLSIIPYLGFVVGIVMATIAAYVQTGSVDTVLLVCGIFLIGHIIENMILTPYLIGNRIGLHPVVVIFAVLAGGCLFGFVGVLLALPAAAVLMVCLRYMHQKYRKSDLYRAT